MGYYRVKVKTIFNGNILGHVTIIWDPKVENKMPIVLLNGEEKVLKNDLDDLWFPIELFATLHEINVLLVFHFLLLCRQSIKALEGMALTFPFMLGSKLSPPLFLLYTTQRNTFYASSFYKMISLVWGDPKCG